MKNLVVINATINAIMGVVEVDSRQLPSLKFMDIPETRFLQHVELSVTHSKCVNCPFGLV